MELMIACEKQSHDAAAQKLSGAGFSSKALRALALETKQQMLAEAEVEAGSTEQICHLPVSLGGHSRQFVAAGGQALSGNDLFFTLRCCQEAMASREEKKKGLKLHKEICKHQEKAVAAPQPEAARWRKQRCSWQAAKEGAEPLGLLWRAPL